MKGYAERKMNRGPESWDLLIGEFDFNQGFCYRLEFHRTFIDKYKAQSGDKPYPVTQINDEELNVLKGLKKCMIQMGILDPSDATHAELEATKRHLEDFRTIVLKGKAGEGR